MKHSFGSCQFVALCVLAFALPISLSAQDSPISSAGKGERNVALLLNPATSAHALASTFGVTKWHSMGTLHGWWLFRAESEESAEALAHGLASRQGVMTVFHDQALPLKRKVNDTYFDSQYSLRSLLPNLNPPALDLNLEVPWASDIKGAGIVVAIVDDGVELNHPDLKSNTLATWSYDYLDDDNDAEPSLDTDSHGTASAGLVAAIQDNNMGITGVAPDSVLIAIRAFSDVISDGVLASSLSHRKQQIDVFLSGFGFPDDGNYHPIEDYPLTHLALRQGVDDGRHGYGNVFVWPAGNGGATKDNSNYDGIANLPETIAVTAVDRFGELSPYAEGGANVLIAAPVETNNIFTTDRLGGKGYNDGTGLLEDGYISDFSGTSAAAAMCSGVVALMLDANPDLTWREVQHILIRTARPQLPSDPDWHINGAGLNFNSKWGYGVLDAGNAVDLATNWNPIGPRARVTPTTGQIATPIGDSVSNPAEATLTISGPLWVEHVVVNVQIDHPNWGELEIVLTSPDGTQSTLAEPHLGNGPAGNRHTLSSLHFWGERANGTWLLTVRDHVNGNQGTLLNWELYVYGSFNEFTGVGGVGPILSPDNPETFSRTEEITIEGLNLHEAKIFIGPDQQTVTDSAWDHVSFSVRDDAPLSRQDLKIVTLSGSVSKEVVIRTLEDPVDIKQSSTSCVLYEGPRASWIAFVLIFLIPLAFFWKRRHSRA